jgi:cohesin loading factor subunit SCC2
VIILHIVYLYRLNGEESIQMVTALVLQLIQCSVKIPDRSESESTATAEGDQNENETFKVTSHTCTLDKSLTFKPAGPMSTL